MKDLDLAKIAGSALKQAGYHSIDIKGKKYTIELLPAKVALAVALNVGKIILPSLGSFYDNQEKMKVAFPEDLNVFTECAVLLVNQLDKTSILDLVDILTANVKDESNAVVDVDKEFRGNLGGLIRLLEFTLKENCGDFFIEYLREKGIVLPSRETDNQE